MSPHTNMTEFKLATSHYPITFTFTFTCGPHGEVDVGGDGFHGNEIETCT